MFNSNIWPNSAPLQDIRLQNLSDLELDLSRSSKVKCDDVIGLSICGFLLNVTACLTDRTCGHSKYVFSYPTQNVFSYRLSLGPNYEKFGTNDSKLTLNAERP